MIKESRLLAEGKTSNVIDEEKLNELFDVKLKIIEEEWVKNNFQISDKQVSQIVNN